MSVLDATFAPITTASEGTPSEEARSSVKAKIDSARDLFTQVAELDTVKDRSGLLALVELERRAREHKFSEGILDSNLKLVRI